MWLSDPSKEQGKLKKARKKSDTRRAGASGIGILVFGAILCYAVFMLLIGASRRHVETYEVVPGSLGSDLTFTGVAIREETCVEPTDQDSVRVVRDNEKIAKGSILFLDRQKAAEIAREDGRPEETLRKSAEAFLFSFSEQNFNTVYSFRQEMAAGGAVYDVSGLSDDMIRTGSVTTSPCDGIVTSVIDGYEGTTASDVMHDGTARASASEHPEGTVKIVSSEEWSVVIPVTDRQVLQLADLRRARVTFLSDLLSETAAVKWLRSDEGGNYLLLQFSSGLIRYLNERFIAVRIEKSEEDGYKIPVTALTKASFVEIPDTFRHLSGAESGIHFMKIAANPDGSPAADGIPTLISPTIYGRRVEVTGSGEDTVRKIFYYVSTADLREGDILQREEKKEEISGQDESGEDTASNADENSGSDEAEDESEEDLYFTVGEAVELPGVFQANNGYALFRRVEIIDENDIWCLVRKGTYCGIVQHDFIVYDSSKCRESMILTQ